jgi:hypothetical protein
MDIYPHPTAIEVTGMGIVHSCDSTHTDLPTDQPSPNLTPNNNVTTPRAPSDFNLNIGKIDTDNLIFIAEAPCTRDGRIVQVERSKMFTFNNDNSQIWRVLGLEYTHLKSDVVQYAASCVDSESRISFVISRRWSGDVVNPRDCHIFHH